MFIEKKIIKDSIVRKRISVANFQKTNVNKKDFSFIFCIPINGLSSDQVQIIRTELKKSGYIVTKYTTKSFINQMALNDFILDKKQISGFYLGQMLIVFIEIPKNVLNFPERKLIEFKHLSFIQSFLNSFNFPLFSNLVYKVDTQNKDLSKRKLIVNSVSEKYGELDKSLSLYTDKDKIKNVVFSKLNDNFLSFLRLLTSHVSFLFSIISVLNRK